jgi:hypothetical protein
MVSKACSCKVLDNFSLPYENLQAQKKEVTAF